MRICDNGVYRDATQEEVNAFNSTPEPGTDDELSGDELADILLGGGEA